MIGDNLDEVKPVTRSVTSQETVAGQMGGLLSQDNPYIKRARASALDYANSRGLANSSIAAGAGEAAAIDAALPIAQQDAGTFSNQALTNQNAQNTFGLNKQGYLFDMSKMREGNKLTQDNMGLQQTFDLAKMLQANKYDQSNMAMQTNLDINKMGVAHGYDQSNMNLQNNLDLGKMDRAAGIETNRMNTAAGIENQRMIQASLLDKDAARLNAELQQGTQGKAAQLNAQAQYQSQIQQINANAEQQLQEIRMREGLSAEQRQQLEQEVISSRNRSAQFLDSMVKNSPSWNTFWSGNVSADFQVPKTTTSSSGASPASSAEAQTTAPNGQKTKRIYGQTYVWNEKTGVYERTQ